MVDEFDGDEYELRMVVDAAQTMPFLTDKRVVVARNVSRFNADDLPALLGYLDNPLDTSDLVLAEGGEGRMSKKITDGVKAAGTVIATAPPKKAGDRATWIRDQIAHAGMKIEPRAIQRADRLAGEEPARLDGVLATLRGAVRRGGHALGGRHRAVPRRGRRGAAVGLHRCDRCRRHRPRRSP